MQQFTFFMIKIVHFELTFLSIDLYIYFAYFGTKTISSQFTRCWDQNKTAEFKCVDKLATVAYPNAFAGFVGKSLSLSKYLGVGKAFERNILKLFYIVGSNCLLCYEEILELIITLKCRNLLHGCENTVSV